MKRFTLTLFLGIAMIVMMSCGGTGSTPLATDPSADENTAFGQVYSGVYGELANMLGDYMSPPSVITVGTVGDEIYITGTLVQEGASFIYDLAAVLTAYNMGSIDLSGNFNCILTYTSSDDITVTMSGTIITTGSYPYTILYDISVSIISNVPTFSGVVTIDGKAYAASAFTIVP